MKKIVLLFSILVCVTCTKNEIIIHDIPFEFGTNNAEPSLVSTNGNLSLSWISSEKGKEASLLYTQYKNDIWMSPVRVASGKNWFVNWADFPSHAINKNLILTSHLTKSDSATYSYDIVLNLQKLNGDLVKENFLLNTDGINAEHGFVSMIPNSNEGFFVTWLDGRNTGSSKMTEGGHHGAMSIRSAEVSSEGTIFNEVELDGKTCDCCQTSITTIANKPLIVYRDRSDGEIRDIYITRNINGTWEKPTPVFNDGWQIKGCPVNGPKIISKSKNVAVAWFTAVNNQPKVKLAFSLDEGETFEVPVEISDGQAIGRVDAVFLSATEVLVSYMETHEEGTYLKCKKVTLNGKASKPVIISMIDAKRSTGVPQLEILGNEVFAVWTISEKGKKQLKSIKFNTKGI